MSAFNSRIEFFDTDDTEMSLQFSLDSSKLRNLIAVIIRENLEYNFKSMYNEMVYL